jgi:hypothetical protein
MSFFSRKLTFKNNINIILYLFNHLVMDQGVLLRVQGVLILNMNSNLRHVHNIKRD